MHPDAAFSPVLRPSLKELVRLRLAWRELGLPHFRGPALVAGSGPNFAMPNGFGDDWAIVSVNASQVLIEPFANRPPDLTIWRGKIFLDSESNNDVHAQLIGRHTKCLLVDGMWMRREGRMAQTLAHLQYRADVLVMQNRYRRAKVYKDVLDSYAGLGRGINIPSNGVFATVLALRLGASPVVTTGISLSVGGHAYRPRDIPRLQADEDRGVLRLIAASMTNVYTTDPAVSRETGLAVWS